MQKRSKNAILIFLILNIPGLVWFQGNTKLGSSESALVAIFKKPPSLERIQYCYTRITEAVKTFKEPIGIPEPKYIIKFGSEYPDALTWIDGNREEILISESIVRDWSIDQLAAVLAHEVAHIRNYRVSNKADQSHWRVDLEATKLVDKEVLLATLYRLRSETKEHKALKKENWILIIVSPIAVTVGFIEDFIAIIELGSRIEKLEALT